MCLADINGYTSVRFSKPGTQIDAVFSYPANGNISGRVSGDVHCCGGKIFAIESCKDDDDKGCQVLVEIDQGKVIEDPDDAIEKPAVASEIEYNEYFMPTIPLKGQPLTISATRKTRNSWNGAGPIPPPS